MRDTYFQDLFFFGATMSLIIIAACMAVLTIKVKVECPPCEIAETKETITLHPNRL